MLVIHIVEKCRYKNIDQINYDAHQCYGKYSPADICDYGTYHYSICCTMKYIDFRLKF